jgi:hypothetical protein
MSVIAEKIHLIESLSSDQNATVRLLDKVIDCLVEDDIRKLGRFRQTLAEFERTHGMSTEEFQRRFDSGELGDAPEWFDWDGYAALAASIEDKLKQTGVHRG